MQKSLLEFPRFRGASQASLAILCQASEKIALKKGTFLFREGDNPEFLFLLQKGSIKVCRHIQNGRELTLDVFHSHEVLGEVALIEVIKYPGSAIALEECSLIKIKKSSYLSFLNTLTNDAMLLIRELCKRIRQQHRRIKELGSGDVEQRLAEAILSNSERSQNIKGRYVQCSMSRLELSNLVGARLETVIRIVSRWIKSGIAEKSTKGIKIKKQDLVAMLTNKL